MDPDNLERGVACDAAVNPLPANGVPVVPLHPLVPGTRLVL
jgi:hypothetical protein